MRFGFTKAKPGRGRGRRVPGTMNKTEAQYEREVLMKGKHEGWILGYGFEDHTFKLGPDLRYTPDFSVQLASGEMEFHEIKAGVKAGTKDGEPIIRPLIKDDSRVKIIVAAEQMPYTFKMRWFDKTAGQWAERVF